MDKSILMAALVGYEVQLQKLQTAIAEIRSQLGQGPGRPAAPIVEGASQPRRQMSAAAKKRIAAGQKKRWAAFHANDTKPVAAKKAAPKRKMSPERKAALVANLAKARAARAAKRAAQQ
jgi:hypothetical protein